MFKSTLENLGLTKSETIVYVTLLELGMSKVGEIIKDTILTSSTVHNTLQGLLEKGLVSYIIKNNIKFYTAANPKILLGILEDKKQELELIIPELIEKQKKNRIENAEIFEGKNGIKTMFYNILEKDLSDKDYFLFFGGLDSNNNSDSLNIDNFYRPINNKFLEQGIETKGICEEKMRNSISINSKAQIKYTDLELPLDLNIIGDSVAIISWSKNPVGILIESEQISSKFKLMWESIWEKSKE